MLLFGALLVIWSYSSSDCGMLAFGPDYDIMIIKVKIYFALP